MWYTTRYEGFDAPTGGGNSRSSKGIASLHKVVSSLLRAGFFFKLIGMTGMILTYYFYRGEGVFTYDLADSTAEQRALVGFRISLCAFAGLYVVGALHIMSFQALLADDASWARGYRAGSKLLGNAALLDVLSGVVQFIIYAYMMMHYDKLRWRQFSAGGPEWLFTALARLLDMFALLYYSSSMFLLEIYHDVGTNDWHGILNAFLFGVSALAELTSLTCTSPAIAIAFHWISLFSALIWSMAFEQEVNASAPLLNETELTNELEDQIEKFARVSPYLVNEAS